MEQTGLQHWAVRWYQWKKIPPLLSWGCIKTMSGIKVTIICYYTATGSVSELPLWFGSPVGSAPHFLSPFFSKAEESSNVYIGVSWELHIGVVCQKYFDLLRSCFHPEPEGKMHTCWFTSKENSQSTKLPGCSIDKAIVDEFCLLASKNWVTVAISATDAWIKQKIKRQYSNAIE